MVRYVFLKKATKRIICPILSAVNRAIPKNDRYILLYAANQGINFNLKPVKEYLVAEDYAKRNKIVCCVESSQYKEPDEPDVVYMKHVRGAFYFFRARHVFYTTGMIPIKPSKKQIAIQLDHGMAFKAVNAMSKINNGYEFYFTYFTAASEAYIPSVCKRYDCQEKNVVINGEPVLDKMYYSHAKYDFGEYKKIALWAPTFRQSDYLGYDDSEESLLPMFEDNRYDELNEVLSQCDIRLLVKLHPSQNVDALKKSHFSNLEILSSEEFDRLGWNLYDLLPQIDFLIADYSSVFLEFLLTEKPIFFVIPDFEEYKEKRGFNFDNPLDLMPGRKIRSKQELFQSLRDIGNGIDDFKEDRLRVKNYIHKYNDGQNTRRAVELSEIRK